MYHQRKNLKWGAGTKCINAALVIFLFIIEILAHLQLQQEGSDRQVVPKPPVGVVLGKPFVRLTGESFLMGVVSTCWCKVVQLLFSLGFCDGLAADKD